MAVLRRVDSQFFQSVWTLRSSVVFAACWFGLVASAMAQKPVVAAKSDLAKNDPLANSALPAPHLSRDRIISQRFADLKKAVGKSDLSTVENLARQLLELPDDRWFGEGPLLHGLRHELIRQLESLPAHLREISLKDANARAGKDLAAAYQKNDVPELLRMVRRYEGTPASHNALRQAALRCFDRGDFANAAMLSARSLPQPEVATADQLPIVLHTAAARVRNGEPDRARNLLLQFSRLLTMQSPQGVQQQIDVALASFSRSGMSPIATNPLEYVFPAVYPRYSRQVLDDPKWSEYFDLAWRNYRAGNPVALPAAFPVIAGSRILLRTYTGLVALDLLSGDQIWECAALTEKPDPKLKRRSLENLSFRDLLSQDLLNFMVSNQVSGACVADNDNAYFVADRYISMPEIRKYPQPGSGSPRNQLIACRLTDGTIAWQAWVSADLADIFFLSEPVIHAGQLYVLGETETEIRLFVINCSDGKLDWQLPLASNDKLSLSHHPARKLRQVKLLWQDGWLICPTGAGCIVAVDSITRSYEWAYRYPTQEEIPKSGARLMGGGTDAAKVVPHPEWRRVGLARDESRVYLASPESDQLHAVNVTSGAVIWKQPRQDGLYLAGLIAGKLIIVGQKSLKGLDPATGNTAWQHEIESPNGYGCTQGVNYLLPLASGKVLLVDAATGKILRGAHGDQQALGNLVQGSGVLISLTAKKLDIYASWESEHQELLTRLKAKPNDPQLLKLMYSQMRRGGDMSQVLELLRTAYQTDPLPAVRVQLVVALVENLTTSPEKREELLRELRPLTELLGKQPDELRCRIQAGMATGERGVALGAALELMSLVTQEEFETGSDKQSQVRCDRALQGLILQILRSAPVAERSNLEQQLDAALQAARASSDPFMLQRFSVQMSELPWGRRARIDDRSRTRIGWPTYRQELSLLDLAEYPDGAVAAPALWALAQDLNERSFRRDAARYDRSLLERFPDVRLDATHTVTEAIASLPQDSLVVKELRQGPTDPWPKSKPLISKPPGRTREPFLMPIPIDAPSGSLLDRINVSVPSHTGAAINRLICQGDVFPGYWEIPLPKSSSLFEGLQDTYYGWGLGNLLVVRLGTQLHGVSVLDDTGEPNGRVVWSLDLAEDLAPPFELGRLRNRQGLGETETIIIDEYGREIGQVHVMLPGYFCYRNRNEIVVVETATGRILWRRHIEQPQLRLTGDAEFLYLVDLRQNHVELVRVMDGVSERTDPLAFSSDSPLILDRGIAIASELVDVAKANETNSGESDSSKSTRKKPAKEMRLRWFHLREMKLLQEQPLPRNSRKMLLDGQTLGVLQPDKNLIWYDLTSGRELGHAKLDVPNDLSQVHFWQDPYRFYVLPSGIPPKYALQRAPQIRNGYRQSLVQGTLHGIDRKTGQVAWRHELEDTFIALDQPRGAPIFVLNFQTLAPQVKEVSTPPAAGELEGVLNVIDRRTGENVYSERDAKLAPDATVELNTEDGWLDIHGVAQRIRIEYPKE
jgi:outer membrane protein assembly factor BamB